MALTVTERPLGHKIIDDGTSFTIFNSAGDAGFTDSLSLTTGDYIYISGYVENYNGFWYVDKSGGIVYLKSNADSDRVDSIVEANVTVFTTEDHGWNCAHLPIVYKLESNLFPVNSVDPIANISITVDSNGYLSVGHSALSGGDALVELDFVNLSDGTNNIVAQVISVPLTTNTIVDLSSDIPYIFTTIQKVRNNYHALVKVYAGLEPSHPWASQKPYELAITLKLIPDSNNEIMFSVNEILKSYLEIRNNDLLATLPNNIDFFTEFYITTQEAYDESNGTDITINYETEVVDSFEGYAANAMLEFKNIYSGYLSDYVLEEAKFLTLFQNPTIFTGKPFDISFINLYEDDITLVIDKYDGEALTTETILYSNPGIGVLRAFIEGEAQYDRYCIQAIIPGGSIVTDITGDLYNKSTFTNIDIPPGGVDWVGANQVTLNGTFDEFSKSMSVLFAPIFTIGTYAITYTVSSTLAWIDTDITLTIFDDLDNVVHSQVYTGITGGAGTSVSRTQTFVISSGSTFDYKYAISILRPSTAAGTSTYEVTSITATETIEEAGFNITEELCLNISSKCSNQELYLTWLNNLGGFDYWNFTDGSDYLRNVGETGETKQNIFPNWPKSYGKTADTIRKQTFRETSKGILVRSQSLSLEELEALEYIKSSILVEIVYARGDKRRVLIDTNSWVSYRDIDKLYTLSFTLDFTDDIPAQRL